MERIRALSSDQRPPLRPLVEVGVLVAGGGGIGRGFLIKCEIVVLLLFVFLFVCLGLVEISIINFSKLPHPLCFCDMYKFIFSNLGEIPNNGN